ncbi:nitrite reductase/ring-hydroxylating ferredoxin subunit [Sphingomonas vulcanisoli]|uniref:Nitrite reductase/ring-hydroxylating ferredoxin subunit n=1 Tax=Sphingomonas vulcanisoli TaxID=1658060 RepID=A0ABX0TX42_9SPHN|nr:non-heme iron oxygenase ferredoxin subunit [Sphingomonas vulcanisoli]NIJ09284.1 nitrite reductase/ring-hydroxylating ferredoxin subunit [Sphingomonas vulcanisoli]
MSDEWTPVAATGDVSEDQPSVGNVDGAEIAIYKVDGDYFATSNICTHGLARLSDGYLDGFLIECPLHQGLFDIRNGKCAGDPVDVDLASYDVRVVNDTVEVRLRA